MCNAQVSSKEEAGKRCQDYLGDKHQQKFPLAKPTYEVYFYFQIKLKRRERLRQKATEIEVIYSPVQNAD